MAVIRPAADHSEAPMRLRRRFCRLLSIDGSPHCVTWARRRHVVPGVTSATLPTGVQQRTPRKVYTLWLRHNFRLLSYTKQRSLPLADIYAGDPSRCNGGESGRQDWRQIRDAGRQPRMWAATFRRIKPAAGFCSDCAEVLTSQLASRMQGGPRL